MKGLLKAIFSFICGGIFALSISDWYDLIETHGEYPYLSAIIILLVFILVNWEKDRLI